MEYIRLYIQLRVIMTETASCILTFNPGKSDNNQLWAIICRARRRYLFLPSCECIMRADLSIFICPWPSLYFSPCQRRGFFTPAPDSPMSATMSLLTKWNVRICNCHHLPLSLVMCCLTFKCPPWFSRIPLKCLFLLLPSLAAQNI